MTTGRINQITIVKKESERETHKQNANEFLFSFSFEDNYLRLGSNREELSVVRKHASNPRI